MKTKLIALAAGVAMAATATAATSAPANADVRINISINGQLASAPLCAIFGARVSPRVVRIKAAWAGYRGLRNIRLHRRHGWGRCGFYRSIGYKFGRSFLIYSSARTGRVLYAKRIGFGVGYRVPGFVVVNKTRAMGYRFIHGLRYHGFVKRYTIKGRKFGRVYRLTFNRFGRYLGRVRVL